jgi:O-antigen/teichoic acid export membrane protein
MDNIEQADVRLPENGKPSGKARLVKDISANSVQIAFSHGLGLVIFYITSRYLEKEAFGEMNWLLAVGATVIALASLGLDLVLVRRISSGRDPVQIAGIHLFHTIASGVVLFLVAAALQLMMPNATRQHPFYLLLFVQLIVANIGNSYKLCLNGMEAYRQLAIQSVVANSIKACAIAYLAYTGQLSLFSVIAVLLAVSLIEVMTGYVLLRRSVSLRLRPVYNASEYKYFIFESIPQLGVVVFDSALARIDWILLGWMGTITATAEYSFAYKVYELEKLPLLIIAPVLLTRFSRIFSQGNTISAHSRNDIRALFRFEMFLMLLLPVLLVSCWTPLVDAVTGGKYGAANETAFIVLSSCIPMICLINFLWTSAFAQGQLRAIMGITITVALVNVALNVLLIPSFQSTGAAFAFLLSTILQCILYYVFVKKREVEPGLLSYLPAVISAVAGILSAYFLDVHFVIKAVVAVSVYTLLCLITGQLNIKLTRETLFGRRPEK